MGFFSFIENFFFISLGVVFILVLLLVYHFKQRMSSVERKGDTMYELVVNMVKEIRFLKAFYPSKEAAEPESEPEKLKEEVFSESPKSVPEQFPESIQVNPISYFIRETSGKIVVSDDSDSESGSDLESGESESESESESETTSLSDESIVIISIFFSFLIFLFPSCNFKIPNPKILFVLFP